MSKFKKGLSIKVISVIIAASFLVTTNVYPDTLPTTPLQHLRKQIDFNNKEELTPRYLCTMLAVAIHKSILDGHRVEGYKEILGALISKYNLPNLLEEIEKQNIQIELDNNGHIWISHEPDNIHIVVYKDGQFEPRKRKDFDSALSATLKEDKIKDKDDLAQVSKGNVYFSKRVFDELPWKEKMKVVIVGTSVWFQAIKWFIYPMTLGLVYFLFRYAKNQKEYYTMAKEAVEQQPIMKPGTGKRIWIALKQGNIFKATELFWSGWNPRVTIVTSIPVYRWLGGNKSPFLASVGAFTFSGFIVHLQLFLIVGFNMVVVICKLLEAPDITPNIILSIFLETNRPNFILGGAYTIFGVIIGLSKEYRKYKYEKYKKGQIEGKTVEQTDGDTEDHASDSFIRKGNIASEQSITIPQTVSEKFQSADAMKSDENTIADISEVEQKSTSLVQDIGKPSETADKVKIDKTGVPLSIVNSLSIKKEKGISVVKVIDLSLFLRDGIFESKKFKEFIQKLQAQYAELNDVVKIILVNTSNEGLRYDAEIQLEELIEAGLVYFVSTDTLKNIKEGQGEYGGISAYLSDYEFKGQDVQISIAYRIDNESLFGLGKNITYVKVQRDSVDMESVMLDLFYNELPEPSVLEDINKQFEQLNIVLTGV